MANGWRSTTMFAGGAIAGGALVLAAYLGWFQPAAEAPPQASRFAVQERPVQAVTVSPDAAAASSAALVASNCPAQPLIAAREKGDGLFSLEAAAASGSYRDPSAFLTVAREAAEQGRIRDAEVAMIAACRVAEQAAGSQSAPVADVKSQLGQHYVALALREQGDEGREALLDRAVSLFSESAEAYAAALGKHASKTQLAERRLASARSPDRLRSAEALSGAKESGRSDASEVEKPGTSELGAARGSTERSGRADDSETTALSRESAEPRERTGSVQRLISGDPELSQLERDMQRLHAQASAVSEDPTGMRQRDAQALAQRESRCRDKACLLQWYSQRRSQLLNEF